MVISAYNYIRRKYLVKLLFIGYLTSRSILRTLWDGRLDCVTHFVNLGVEPWSLGLANSQMIFTKKKTDLKWK